MKIIDVRDGFIKFEADKSIYYPRENKTNKDFTVLYFGSILPLQGVSVILEAINLLKDEKGLRVRVRIIR